jgi:hypothetical protein
VFRAFFPAIHGTGARLLASAEGAHQDGIDDDQIGVELARLTQQTQQIDVQAVPDAHLLPESQAAVGRHARAAQLRRDILPAAAARQDEPQHIQHGTMAHTRPTAFRADGLFRRQVVSGEIEERIGHAGSGHDRHPLAKEACPSYVQVPCRRFC